MLVIIKRMSAVLSRPKYYPTSRHAQWCVYDTETKLTVYGPVTRSAAQRYIDEETHMSIETHHDAQDGNEEFPCLMQNPDSGTVFLITEKKHTGAYTGFILADGTSNPSSMGKFSDHWQKKLVPYMGAITLSNQTMKTGSGS